MYKAEILRLQNQITKLEEIYITRKNNRENLVKEMNELDKRLEELEKNINTLNKQKDKNSIKRHMIKLKNKELLKFCTKQCIKYLLQTIVVLILANFIFWKFKFFKEQLLVIASAQILLCGRDYIKNREKNPKNKKITKKKQENVEKEYQEVKAKRIAIGQQYKQVREREISAYNVYKTTQQLVTDRINYLNQISINYSVANDTIKLNDIYHLIPTYWGEYFEDTETTKKLLDEQLRKYLITKIGEINYDLSKSRKLDELTTKDLVAVLANYIPKNKHNETLSHIIHAVLGYASNMQSYGIVWFEEKDESLIASPSIMFDENGKWNELKTHRYTDYVETFNKVYDTFFNNFMIKEKTRIK